MLSMSRAVLVGIAAVAFVGCDHAPTGPARSLENQGARMAVEVNETQLPFAFNVQGCGEIVHVEGEFHVVIGATGSKSGNATLRFHINAKGTATGLTSGATYQWNDAINETDGFRDGLLTHVNFSETTTLIGQGGAPNLKFIGRFHVTMNANGDATVIIDRAEIICS
jgi:hypothetical protein